MSKIIIRPATKDDAVLIADLSRETFYNTFASFNTAENMEMFLDKQFTKDALIAEVGAPGNIFILCLDNDKAVGYARMREKNIPPELQGVNAMEIARIYAITDSIGKGVGKALMNECINISRSLQKEAIWLGVWEKNERAITFYTKWGFEKFSEHPFLLGTDKQTDWLMIKRL